MEFEFDNNKSKSNKQKHGIDFIEAQQLFAGDTVEIDLVCLEEKRFLVIGKIKGKFWTAVATIRGERIRIISVRRSRKNERNFYNEKWN